MSSRDFLKIPNENGEFNIIVKRFSMKEKIMIEIMLLIKY